jgi:hypothetical protein
MKRFFLCLPKPLELRSEDRAPMTTKDVIALDQGVRTFMAGYSPPGELLRVGKGDVARIYCLA